MTKKTFSIRNFEMSDVGSILQFLELVFKRRFSDEWWNWKYRLNPAGFWGEQGDILIAKDDDNQVIGTLATLPAKIKLGPETVTALQVLDLAIHPNYRGLGNYRAFWEKLRATTRMHKRYSFLFGFPNDMAVKPVRRWGWTTLPMVEFLNFLNYDRSLRDFSTNGLVFWSEKTALKAIRSVRHISQILLLKRYAGDPVEIRKVERFPDEMNNFWGIARAEYETVLERTATFLNWRFSKHFGDYQIYIARSVEKGNIVGYLVLRKTQIRNIKNVLDIVDLHALPHEDKCMLNLIETAISVGKDEELNLLHCRIPRWHKYASILHKLGFVSLGRTLKWVMYRPHLVVYPLKEKGVPEVQKWFYTLADTDYA